jgi:hypothetical protein
MKIRLKTVLAASVLGSTLAMTGCMYGGIAASGDSVVITRNDMFLAGLLRKVFVCQVTPGGVTQCMEAEAP